MAYVTTAELRAYLGISGSGDDTLLDALIAAAQSMVDAYTGRTFEAAGDTTHYMHAVDDVDGVALFVDGDLCAITTVTNGDAVEVASDEYTTMPRNRTPYYSIVLLPSSQKSWTYSTDPEGAISVLGRWAYSTTAPADVAHACKRLAGYLYRQKDNANDIDRALVVGNATVLPSDLPRDVKQILSPYVRLTR
jgi:hypothetical protein